MLVYAKRKGVILFSHELLTIEPEALPEVLPECRLTLERNVCPLSFACDTELIYLSSLPGCSGFRFVLCNAASIVQSSNFLEDSSKIRLLTDDEHDVHSAT